MSLLEIADITYRILRFLDPKSIFTFMLLNRRSNALIQQTLGYQDLIKLRDIEPQYAFGSADIIVQYYRY